MSMTTRRALLGVGAAFALLLAPTAAFAEPSGKEPLQAAESSLVTLDLYNLTDVHGHIEQVAKKGVVREAGLPAMNCYLKEARAANPNSSFTLLGDNIGASPYTSGSLKDNPTIAALNTLAPLASTIGNHELDMGQEVFKQRVDGSKPDEFVQVGFPYLGANIEGMGSWTKGGAQTPYLGDYKIWNSPSGVKVAFIGAIAEDVPYKLSPGTTTGLTFTDPLAKIDSLAKSIKDKGEAQIVIAMLDDDVKNNYPKVSEHVDGIMGGDTHVPYEFDHVDSAEKLDSKNPLLAGVASGSYTDNLGLIRISYDKAAHKVVSADTQLIPAATVAKCGADPATQAVVDQAVADSQEAGKTVVGTGYTQSFKRGVFTTPAGATDPGSNRGIESSLGDFVADAMRETVLVEGKPVDIGIINAGGLRDDLIPNEDGTITYAQSYSVMPFSNELGYVTITGADFKRALEQQWKTDLNSQNSRPLLKLGISSNVRYTYDPTKPYGERITSVMVNDEPLDPAKTYTVGSVTFLLSGGDSFDALTAGGPAKTNGNLDRDKFNEFLAAHSGAAPRAAKSAIGLSLPSQPVAEGTKTTIHLRGLSFSEGPSITQNVTLSLDGMKASAPVDNSLLDEHASDEAAVITTDGAGRASVEITATAGARCAGLPEGEVVNVPISVATDFAEVVTASQKLSVPVICPAVAPAPQPTPSQSAAPQPTASQSASSQPEQKAPQAQPSKGTKLANTGAPTDLLAGAAILLALMGAGMIARERV
ncbi:5'-nucleotidase C-terminal domain-containing protein [Actinomyces trachealis]|uniref:5'-nucleotidase C-terminal domain-containing protein n=1 Tax=Actinomyces trachealis TaxID=2763540 RepID=UPI001892A05E|nr:5'-nucleotidase C-terminal domain-containing protein [Actinomyces trachealis]